MIYFDTDVLIHYFVKQDAVKNLQANQLFHKTTDSGLFFISYLSLQETAFVLSKLQINRTSIDTMISALLPYTNINYGAEQFIRGKELAKKVGFQNITDCLHVAIAERYCNELYTFNKSDFKRLQKYTSVKISIL